MQVVSSRAEVMQSCWRSDSKNDKNAMSLTWEVVPCVYMGGI